MSLKTPRPFKDPAIHPTIERTALRVVAGTVALLALAPTPAFTLELGEAAVRSALGQSLIVHIPYRLTAGEQLMPACIALAPAARADRALPTYSRLSRIVLTATHIEIYGDTRILEPLIGLTVDVHCHTAPHFVRSYQLFIDPPGRMPALTASAAVDAPVRRAPPAASPLSAQSRSDAPSALPGGAATSGSSLLGAEATAPRPNVSERARGRTGGALAQGQTYTVVRGDTLSGIAARVGDRPTTVRAAADAIFTANPDAFARGNRDLLEAGRAITIPFMAATTAAPAPSAVAPAPVVRELEPPSTAPAPISSPTANTAATETPRTAVAGGVVVPEATAPAASSVAVVQPSTARVPTSDDVTAEAANPATSASTSTWLTVLLALGATLLLAAPLLFVRRHKRDAAVQDPPESRLSTPRRLVDPAAGFDVVEGRLGRTQANEKVTAPNVVAALPLDSRAVAAHGPEPDSVGIDPAVTVDLDVGAPSATDEHVDWFRAHPGTAATAAAADGDDTLETAATTRMPQPEGPTTVSTPALESTAAVAETAIDDDDEQHTLTIVELDMLRQDYETEHTLTQQSSKALRDAVADLQATQAARAAAGETVTLEMPRSHSESNDGSSEGTVDQKRSAGR